MRADYISPHEGTSWHQNDFRVGEEYVAEDRVFTCLTSGVNQYGDVELTVRWEDGAGGPYSVWPNSQWIALNWTDGIGE